MTNQPAQKRDPDLDHKFTGKHSLTVEVTEQNLHDQITAAIEYGSHYWARIDTHAHKRGWANYFTATFEIHEISDETKGAIHGKSYTLSIPKLMQGLAVLAAKYPHHFCDILKEDGDATTGDVLVQCALFGDIVYG
jgi:hypothetical protein